MLPLYVNLHDASALCSTERHVGSFFSHVACLYCFNRWASGTFGFFGIEKSEISNPALNFVGVAIAVFATLLYMRVETESSPPAQPGSITQRDSALRSPFLEEANSNRSLVMTGKDVSENDEKENDGSKKTIGIVLALTAGALFGFNFDPVEYLKVIEANIMFCLNRGHATIVFFGGPFD